MFGRRAAEAFRGAAAPESRCGARLTILRPANAIGRHPAGATVTCPKVGLAPRATVVRCRSAEAAGRAAVAKARSFAGFPVLGTAGTVSRNSARATVAGSKTGLAACSAKVRRGSAEAAR
jgi:hypothetical protein